MQKLKGFTLIEVLIATAVIALGIVASYVVVQQIFAYSFATSYRLTAAYLAKEGIEIVRNIRDTGWIQELAWNNNGLFSGYWQADYSHTTVLLPCLFCNGTSNDFNNDLFFWYLKYPIAGNPFYRYSLFGSKSLFKRRIRIQRPTADSIKATVDVMWKERGVIKSLTVEGDLYDWR